MRSWQKDWRVRWGATAVVLSLVGLVPHFNSEADLTRVRNALVLDEVVPARALDWQPQTRPMDFLTDGQRRDARFVRVVDDLKLDGLEGDWERAVAISAHLLERAKRKGATRIANQLWTTYASIRADGEGYCVDYARAFGALAQAADLQFRYWAFSFDGFGGRGHILPEVWDAGRRRWIALDVFNNLQFRLRGRLASASEIREALLTAPKSLTMEPLVPQARAAFHDSQRALDYYVQGRDLWYQWWGTNLLEVDQSPVAQFLQGDMRPLSQLDAIVRGIHPRMHVAAHPSSERAVRELRVIRLHFMAAGLGLLVGAGLLLSSLVSLRRRLRVGDLPIRAEGAIG